MKKIFNSDFQITQGFGLRPEYYSQFKLKGHEGVDLIPTGSDWTIFSPEGDGTVVKDIDDPKAGGAYGETCTIWYPKLKIALQFCHMSENYVSLNDNISEGQKIGKMGATGNTQGAHLHLNRFEVDDNGIRLNKDNGYLGGTDPVPFLTGSNEPMVTIPQKELDEIRLRRDELFNQNQELIAKEGEYQKQISELQSATNTLNAKISDLSSAIEKDAVNDHDTMVRLHDEEMKTKSLEGALSDATEALKKAMEKPKPIDKRTFLEKLRDLFR